MSYNSRNSVSRENTYKRYIIISAHIFLKCATLSIQTQFLHVYRDQSSQVSLKPYTTGYKRSEQTKRKKKKAKEHRVLVKKNSIKCIHVKTHREVCHTVGKKTQKISSIHLQNVRLTEQCYCVNDVSH